MSSHRFGCGNLGTGNGGVVISVDSPAQAALRVGKDSVTYLLNLRDPPVTRVPAPGMLRLEVMQRTGV